MELFEVALKVCDRLWQEVQCPYLFAFPNDVDIGFPCIQVQLSNFHRQDFVNSCCSAIYDDDQRQVAPARVLEVSGAAISARTASLLMPFTFLRVPFLRCIPDASSLMWSMETFLPPRYFKNTLRDASRMLQVSGEHPQYRPATVAILRSCPC